jgi:hypothetical protein
VPPHTMLSHCRIRHKFVVSFVIKPSLTDNPQVAVTRFVDTTYLDIMFSNTGTTSIVLYGIFILVTVGAMVVAFYYIKKGYDSDKLSKMIELFKYAIVTISIATVTLIISDLFKEREQQLKELEYFGKYVEDVKKADGIQTRYELTRYLSIVAPSGELKKSWQRYYDTLKIEYKEYLRLQQEKQTLDSIKKPTKEQLIQKEKLNEKIQEKNLPLGGRQRSVISTVECWIHFADKNGYPIARNLDVNIRRGSSAKPFLTYLYEWTNMKPTYLLPGNYTISVEFKGGEYESTVNITPDMDQPIVLNLETEDNP